MDSSQHHDADQTPIKRPSQIARILIWGGVFLVLIAVMYEASSRQLYDSSLKKLQVAIVESKKAGPDSGLPVAEIDKHLTGFRLQHEESAGRAAPTGGNNGASVPRRKIVYHWPSLLGNYQFAVMFDQQNRAVLIEDGYHADVSTKSIAAAPRALPKAGLAQVPDQTVVLETDEPSIVSTMRKARLGSLARELFRQSFLIAARDELGLGTLDASLGEVSLVNDSPKAFPFHLDVTVQGTREKPDDIRFIVHLTRADASGNSFKWSSTPTPISAKPELDALVDRLEPLSRGDFVAALKAAGFPPSSAPAPAAEPAAPPGEFRHRLDFVAQYTVLRQLHAQRRATGETVDNLGGLVRAYANLGSLTDFHWSPAPKVFKARALIYAQRMITKYGRNANTLAHRSYAWTLVGNHVLALQDAKAARSFQPEAAPEWLNLMEAFCEYEPTALQNTDGSLQELAEYLRMRLLDPYHEMQSAVPAIQEVIDRNPACSRAIERMCETHTLGMARRSTEGVADQAWHGIYDRLTGVPNLPPKALQIAEKNRKPAAWQWFGSNEHAARVKLMAELRQAATAGGDRNELSWNVLADMINDVSFVQTERAITVQFQWLGLTPEQVAPTVEKLAPLVANHRFGKFLSCFANDRPASLVKLTEVVNSTKSTDYELPCVIIANSSYQANPEFYTRLCSHIDNHWDKIYDDLLGAIGTRFPGLEQEAWIALVEISPHQPLAIARAIHKSPEFTDAKAAEWERRYQDNGYVMLELGRKYLALGRSDDALRCMEQSVKVAPTHEAFFALADEYENREEIELSREALEEALRLESYGLENGQTHNKLAHLLMYQGQWKEAQPHALDAAATYSGWGLVTAARCAEGLKQWNVAENYYRAASERYESSSGDKWYFSCLRLGRGDLKASRQLAEKYWKTFVPPLASEQQWSLGLSQIVDGDLKKAIGTFNDSRNIHHHDPHLLLVAAILADKLGEKETRDALYGQIETRFSSNYAMVQLINLFRNALRDSNQFQWNRYSFYELTDDLNYNDVCFAYYCAGEFLAIHGDSELSREYLECAATSYDVHRHTCLLANVALRGRKIEIGESRLHRQPEDRIPTLELHWRAGRARRKQNYTEARKDLDEALRIRPDFTAGLAFRGKISEAEGRYDKAIEDYQEVLRINPNSENSLGYLCFLQACCPDDKIRNGPEALKHAERGFELSITKMGNEYWSLAAAHAECGNFQKAIEFQEQALKRSPENAFWKKQLELYRDGKAYRFEAPKAVEPLNEKKID